MESAKRVILYMRQRFGLLAPYVALTAPASPVLGDLWSDTTAGLLKRWDGAAWVAISGGAPAAHASSHQNGGSDEVAVAAAAANAIPKAGAGGRLAVGWEPAIMGAMKQIYANTVAGAAVTSWSITSGLAGDTDLMYLIRFRLIEAQLNTVLGITFNNDGAGNYADTGISNTNTTVAGTRNTAQTRFPLAFVNAAGHTAEGLLHMWAVSGFVRHMFLQAQEQVTATVPTTVVQRSGIWTNTADAITRIDVTSSIASGIGIGSHLEIWALRPTYAATS